MQSGSGDAGDGDRETVKEGNDKQQREEGVRRQPRSADGCHRKGQRQHRAPVSHQETRRGGEGGCPPQTRVAGKRRQRFKTSKTEVNAFSGEAGLSRSVNVKSKPP